MGLFSKKKEKSECCCCGNCNHNKNAEVKNATVKILGSGCKKCNQLEENTKRALEQLNMDTTIDHVTDFSKIAEYGVMSTPAIVVDEKVISYGKVLKTEEIVNLLKKARG